MEKNNINEEGFTLLEMMISLLIGMLVLVVVCTTFVKQNDSQLIQEDVTELLQNSRVARLLIANDLRMAGYYGPNGPSATDLPFYPFPPSPSPPPTLLTNTPATGALTPNSLVMRYLDDSVGAIRVVGYDLYDSSTDNDAFSDDMGWTTSTSATPGLKRPLIGNVEGLEFMYTINNGTSAVNTVTLTPSTTSIPNIKAVTVTMLLRGGKNRSGLGVTDTTTYRTPFGTVWGPFDNGFKRRLVSFTVSCRNLEL